MEKINNTPSPVRDAIAAIFICALCAPCTTAHAQSPIYDLIKQGKIDSVSVLLDAQPSLANETAYCHKGRKQFTATPLRQAINFSRPDIVRLLLKRGADVNAVDSFNITPLVVAVTAGKFEIVRILLDNHADASLLSPLRYAIDTSIYLLLEQHGGKIPEEEKSSWNPIEILTTKHPIDTASMLFFMRRGADVNFQDLSGSSALIVAAGNTDSAAIRILLEHGADVNATDTLGNTALGIASQRGHRNIVQLLLDHHAEVTPKEKFNDRAQKNIVLLPVEQAYDVPTFLLLERNGADLRTGNDHGFHLLNECLNNHDTVKFLFFLRHGADIHAHGFKNESLAYRAMQDRTGTLTKFLIDHGVEAFENNSSGKKEMMDAAQRSNVAAMRILLDHGADADAADSLGRTALMIAVEKSNREMVQLLLEHHANVFLRSKSQAFPLAGKMAIEVALDTAIVSLLEQHGASLTASGDKGWYQLSTSLLQKDTTSFLFFLHRGADIHATERGDNLFSKTLRDTTGTLLDFLVRNGLNINTRNITGATILFDAAHDTTGKLAQRLIDRGADVNAEDSSGETVLNFIASSSNQNVAMMKILLAHGADINHADHNGATPLFAACKNFRQDPVPLSSFLIEQGAEINPHAPGVCAPLFAAVEMGNDTIVNLLITHHADLAATSPDGVSLAAVAAGETYHQTAGRANENGYEYYLHSLNNRYQSPYREEAAKKRSTLNSHVQLRMREDSLRRNMIDLLERNGAPLATRDKKGQSPIFAAEQNGFAEVCKCLVAHGADLNTRDHNQRTPIFRVLEESSDRATLPTLIKIGVDINVRDNRGATPLHVATMLMESESLDTLLANGANVNARDDSGRTPLHWAAEMRATKNPPQLINPNAKISDTLKARRDTALLDRRKKPTIDMVKLLLHHGADPTIKDNNGQTPFDVAKLDEVKNILRDGKK